MASSPHQIAVAAALYAQEDELTPTDRDRLVAFLSSDTGKFILGKLKALAPNVRDTKGMRGEHIIAESMREKGYMQCIDTLVSFIESREVTNAAGAVPEAFPDLDNDEDFDPVTNLPKARA